MLATGDFSQDRDMVAKYCPIALPFGNGRSYGDSCLNSRGTLLLTRGCDRFIDFAPIDE